MTAERQRERFEAYDRLPTFTQIVQQNPREYVDGFEADPGAKNPYPQSFHFDLTVNDAKHIAWREGYNLRRT